MLAMQHLFKACDVMYRLHYLLISKYNLDICNKQIVVKGYFNKKTRKIIILSFNLNRMAPMNNQVFLSVL